MRKDIMGFIRIDKHDSENDKRNLNLRHTAVFGHWSNDNQKMNYVSLSGGANRYLCQ